MSSVKYALFLKRWVFSIIIYSSPATCFIKAADKFLLM